ncbi:3-hydroxyacyl-CoA dehydrogenase NAD-binding domain-containing protein [Microbulbifer sp. VAAF005]|uniref:3-hydroxyacyl-CoA dehydrogenase NAD-binding domain-containing protein n=1 Tax=Microbulbifer sp. VAAF005 TaxID=3034230 RepID=UPI0024ACA827|nr:3-hydroxyacyl-CoA dehydrogenase NAD-binding domain-containing protein [Microbulbifer sp. VAAF005]WHI45225.1 3-hydroxyacyl-CoA dehydrogenase NAD-binding domain-containing protein [Microbulbifer sp. VAAF005]
MKSIRLEKDDHNIVHLIMDNPNASANVMDRDFTESLSAAVQQLKQQEFSGIIVRSTKNTFFAGGDLKSLYAAKIEEAKPFFESCESMKANLRWLETQGKPVVAAINGTALGGGWEIALSCHQRIVIDSTAIKLGLPEVTLGLLPGGGGCVRMPRLLGIQESLPYLLEGKQVRPQQALKAGLVHQLVTSESELLEKAVSYIRENSEQPVAQPWDQPDYRMPGGDAKNPKNAQLLMIAPAMLEKKTKGCLPAPESIMATVVEGSRVDFETATRIESRHFVGLACGQVAKNMIGTFWFALNEVKAGASLPAAARDHKTSPMQKIGILGAGMMGSAIAYACASKGVDVVLKDVSMEGALAGKQYAEKSLQKRLQRGRITEDKVNQILSRITPTDSNTDLADCELVIEAVFEDRELKRKVTQEAEAQLPKNAVFASNTSTLPITGLAQASDRPQQFIGLHFFSPADKMPLVEIICGEQTSDETLAQAFAFVLQIGKTPIVVNDSRGFFTSRVFGCFTNEGIGMLSEGVNPATIENAAALAGFPVGPLAVSDEVSLTLMSRIRQQTINDLQKEGKPAPTHPADGVIDRMLEVGRAGKAAGGGFYTYPEGGKKHLWSGLEKEFPAKEALPIEDVKERLLFIMALETLRCYQEDVLRSVRDANIGSIFGIGFPPWTGGALQYISQFGLKAFTQRAQQLADAYGDRFAPPAILLDLAESGKALADNP